VGCWGEEKSTAGNDIIVLVADPDSGNVHDAEANPYETFGDDGDGRTGGVPLSAPEGFRIKAQGKRQG